MRRRPDERRPLLVAALLLAASTTAQGPPKSAVVTFASPDGSRFVLVPDATIATVHWAIATFVDAADEPPGLEGLAMATARASLGGTWQTGSGDAAAERQALALLDQAWVDLLMTPGNPAGLQTVRDRETAATRLGDDMVFRRVLAALPVHEPEIAGRSPVCVLSLTTLPSAIGDVGTRLVERREQQALRGLPNAWMQEVVARQKAFDLDPFAAIHAELLALAMPNHPAARAAERPGRIAPRRDQALATWHATQRPERTVHVLVGGFDVLSTRAALTAVFARTQLPEAPPAAVVAPRPIQGMRRSTVLGVRRPTVAIAWVLPAISDPLALEVAARWLGGGSESWLGRALQKAGRKDAVVSCQAPWPAAAFGRSLLLVEVVDPGFVDPVGVGQLAEQVLAACRDAIAKPPPATALLPALTDLQREWTIVTGDPRRHAAELARTALLWPQLPGRLGSPTAVDPRAVQAMLTAVFAGQPAIVEGRR